MNSGKIFVNYLKEMLRKYEENLKEKIFINKQDKNETDTFFIEVIVNMISEKEIKDYMRKLGYRFVAKHKGCEANLAYLRENKYFSEYFGNFFEINQANFVIKYDIFEFDWK